MDDAALEERIRNRAYEIWLEEGCPEGRSEEHWDLAQFAVSEEDNQRTTLKKPELPKPEPIEAVENQGEFPTMTDQGEQQIPHRSGESNERREQAPPLQPGQKNSGDQGQ